MDYKTYSNFINEYFDIKDSVTRKKLVSLSEAKDQNAALLSASIKLYELIEAKVTDIDFGEIPKSKGDITKIPNFMELVECTNTIHTILVQNKQSTESTDTILNAIENMKVLKPEFEKAFVINCDIVVLLYNTMALSIVSAVSYLISTTIDFVRDPAVGSYEISLQNTSKTKSKDHILYKNLKKFNKSCATGQMKKSLIDLLRATSGVNESGEVATLLSEEKTAVTEEAFTAIVAAIAGTATIIALIGILLPIIQEVVCFFYCAKQSISDYFSIQSDVVRLNAENVKLDMTKTPAEREKIYKKQVKIADSFKKISTKLSVKMKGSNKSAETMIDKERSSKMKFTSADATIAPSSIF